MENVKKENRFSLPRLKFSWEKEDKERKQILSAYRKMMSKAKDVSWAAKGRIRKAFEYAAKAHDGMRRKSGEPYILHPLAVASILVQEMELDDPISIMCALLHDVVEDTEVSLDDIEQEFGQECRDIVDGLTKIKGTWAFDENRSEQAENFRKILLTISHDIRVVLIKLADRLHNMRTLGSMKRTSALKIASETLYIYAPLAHRLGLYEIKSELEDHGLKHSQPEVYDEIEKKLDKVHEIQENYAQEFIRQIREELKGTKLKFKIQHRFKTVHSVYKKMKKQNVPFEEVFDLFAVRIILRSKPGMETADCWRVYSVVSHLFSPNPKRLRDWITHPKENGYEALHVTVLGPEGRWVEVQIRTERMDRVAEKGIAAHWKYKENGDQYEETLNQWIEQVRETLENPSLTALDAVREFRENLRPHNLYVFTPRGKLIRVPTGATALDFAYQIHSNIGDCAIGAKVGNELLSLDYELKSGDQVEILTSRKVQAKEEWLRYVVTNHAKKHIKRALSQQRREAIEKGHELYQRGLTQYKFPDTQHTMRELLTFMRYPTPEDFYFALGMKKINTDKIKEFIDLKKEGKKLEEAHIEDWERKIRMREQQYRELGFDIDDLVLTKGQNISKYKLAKCCNPVRGDDILGILLGDTLEIHQPNCQKAISLMSSFGRSIIQVRWSEEYNQVDFLASIKVVGLDRKGMLMELLHVITTAMKLNLSKVSIESQDHMFEGLFNVYVSNTEDIEALLKRFSRIKGVITATRTSSDFVPFSKE